MLAPFASNDPEEFFAAATIEDPHPFFARLRAERPISRISETGVHLVASWSLIEDALQREADFSANLTGVLARKSSGQPTTLELPYSAGTNVIATADEPSHAVHRKLAQPHFSAERISTLEPLILDWAAEAVAPWLAAQGGDFVPISEAVPARVVAHLLGLPGEDVSQFRAWAMMGGDILAGDIETENLLKLARETSGMADYLGEHLALAGRRPRTNEPPALLHTLAQGVDEGRIDKQEAIGIAIVMFGAGGESTSALIGSAMRLLAERPELAERLRREPGLVPRFVEEAVRLEPPFKFHYRAVRRDCELGGCELRAGDRLMLLWSAANRDPELFEDPDSIQLDRKYPKNHLSFGRGSHFCIGAPLARLEARILLGYALAYTRSIELIPGSPPVHAPSLFIRRLEKLPLRLGGGPSVQLGPSS